VYISPYCRQALVPQIFMKFGIRGQLTDVIMSVKFFVDRFRGYGVLTPPFPMTCCTALITVYALPCDTVKSTQHFSKPVTQNKSSDHSEFIRCAQNDRPSHEHMLDAFKTIGR